MFSGKAYPLAVLRPIEHDFPRIDPERYFLAGADIDIALEHDLPLGAENFDDENSIRPLRLDDFHPRLVDAGGRLDRYVFRPDRQENTSRP